MFLKAKRQTRIQLFKDGKVPTSNVIHVRCCYSRFYLGVHFGDLLVSHIAKGQECTSPQCHILIGKEPDSYLNY